MNNKLVFSYFVFILITFIMCQEAVAQVVSLDNKIVWNKGMNGSNDCNIDISPDGKYIVTGDVLGSVFLYDLKTGDSIKTIKVQNGEVRSAKFSRDGKYLVVSGEDYPDGLISVISTITWDTVRTIRVKIFELMHCADILPDDKYIVGTMSYNGIYVWDFATGNFVKSFPAQPPPKLNENPEPWRVEFSRDGKYLAVGAYLNPAQLIDFQTGETKINNGAGIAYVATLSKDGQKFACSYEDILTAARWAEIWDVASRKLIAKLDSGLVSDALCDYIDFSPNNRFISIGGGIGQLQILDIDSFKILATANLNPYFVKFTPDSNYLLTNNKNGAVLIDLRAITGIKENDVPNNNINKILNIYPNPSSDKYTIEFSLSRSQLITLKVDDLTGREVSVLVNQFTDAGEHTIGWNTNSIPSGTYFIRLISKESTDTKQLMISK